MDKSLNTKFKKIFEVDVNLMYAFYKKNNIKVSEDSILNSYNLKHADFYTCLSKNVLFFSEISEILKKSKFLKKNLQQDIDFHTIFLSISYSIVVNAMSFQGFTIPVPKHDLFQTYEITICNYKIILDKEYDLKICKKIMLEVLLKLVNKNLVKVIELQKLKTLRLITYEFNQLIYCKYFDIGCTKTPPVIFLYDNISYCCGHTVFSIQKATEPNKKNTITPLISTDALQTLQNIPLYVDFNLLKILKKNSNNNCQTIELLNIKIKALKLQYKSVIKALSGELTVELITFIKNILNNKNLIYEEWCPPNNQKI
jgi:hypothetical protein